MGKKKRTRTKRHATTPGSPTVIEIRGHHMMPELVAAAAPREYKMPTEYPALVEEAHPEIIDASEPLPPPPRRASPIETVVEHSENPAEENPATHEHPLPVGEGKVKFSGVSKPVDETPPIAGRPRSGSRSRSVYMDFFKVVDRTFHAGKRDDLSYMVGAHGAFQRATFNFGLIVAFVLPFQAMVPQILTPDVNYWCARPSKNISSDEWKDQMIPKMENGEYSKCEMFVVLKNGTWITKACQSWEFDIASYGFSIVQEYEMVCHNAWLLPISSSIFLVGGLCALLVSGPVSDKFGRKPVVKVCVMISQVVAVAIIFCRFLYAFLVMRFLLGAALTTLLVTSLVLVIEVMSPDMRSIYGIAVILGQTTGNIAMACVSCLRINWHILQFVGIIPTFMMLRAFYSVTESPRWLISKGRLECAEAIIMHAAHINDENTLEVKKTWMRTRRQLEKEERLNGGGTFADFLGMRESWKNTIILYYCSTVISFAYFTMGIRIRKSASHPDVMLLIASLMDLCAQLCAILCVASCGRRTGEALCLCCAGFVSFVAASLTGVAVLTRAVTMVACASVAASYSIIWLYAAEIYPTIIRNTGLALCYAFSRLGSTLAPLTEYVSESDAWLPTLIVAALCGCAAVVTLQLPDTDNVKLRDVVHDVHSFSRPVETHGE